MFLEKYSIGVGDRFARQGKAQLNAIIRAGKQGIDVSPVWNKSHREHTIIGTRPQDVRAEADRAVRQLNFSRPYYVDADHIGLKNVDLFLDSSDFFTLDVADFIGQAANEKDIAAFTAKHSGLVGAVSLPRVADKLDISRSGIERIARKYLLAVKEAGRIYHHIEKSKGRGNFVTEVSMDETAQPQMPAEMLFILAAIADEHIPAQTIAPRFSGRFNKGVDYVGEPATFAKEFEQDLAVIALAVEKFDLPEDLKLSIHSGSDKFSIYRPVNKALKKFDAGLHIKTAGTTWLEELTGLAMAGGQGLETAKQIYEKALPRFDELCAAYACVIDIDRPALPSPEKVRAWSGEQFAAALRHERRCPDYNPNFRQLLHVAYKIAAEMGKDYINAVEQNEKIIAENVTENIYARHIKPIFVDE